MQVSSSFFFLCGKFLSNVNFYWTRCLLHYSSAYTLHSKLLCISQVNLVLYSPSLGRVCVGLI